MKSLFLFLFTPSVLLAEIWVINRDHSGIHFEVPYLQISSVHGKFNSFGGSIQKKDDLIEQVNINIRSETIDTGINLRDTHLRSNDFLAVKEYPEILFNSKKIIKNGMAYLAEGELKFKTDTIPLTIEFTLSEVVKDTWEKLNRFVKFTGKLYKKDLKIDWNKTLPKGSYLLGNEIKISGSFQLQPKGNLTASSKHKTPDNKYLRNRERFQRGETNKLIQMTEGIKTMPSLLKEEPAEQTEIISKESFKSKTDWFSYMAFTLSFLFGLFGSVALCYFLYPIFEKRKWHDNEFLDDNFKHIVYLLIIGGYVYFTSLLFPF